MPTFTPSPALLELREEIDALDTRLANLLCQRLELIHRAAPLKPTRECVRLEDRIEEIIEKVTPIADNYDINRQYLESVFRYLIDQSIESELRLWDKMHPNQASD